MTEPELNAKGNRPLQPMCAYVHPDGKPCGNRATRGYHKCWHHGARQSLAMRGPANPNFVNGATAKYHDHALAGIKYVEALQNPDLLNNTNEIALIEALIQQAGTDLKGVIDPDLWEQMQGATTDFRDALRAKDTPAQMKAFATIERLTARGVKGSGTVRAVREMVQERNRLVVDQNRINQMTENTVTREQVIGFIMAVADLINKKVRDRHDREAVQIGLMQLMGAPS